MSPTRRKPINPNSVSRYLRRYQKRGGGLDNVPYSQGFENGLHAIAELTESGADPRVIVNGVLQFMGKNIQDRRVNIIGFHSPTN